MALWGNPHCARSHAHALEPPQGAPSPGTEPSTCYDPALAALLHASPIASRWRRRRILARRNLIRQAAPPGPSAKRVPPKGFATKQKGRCPPQTPERFCPASLCSLAFSCFPPICTTRPQTLCSTSVAVATTLNFSSHTFLLSKIRYIHNPRRHFAATTFSSSSRSVVTV